MSPSQLGERIATAFVSLLKYHAATAARTSGVSFQTSWRDEAFTLPILSGPAGV
jgi:hypothetical protein